MSGKNTWFTQPCITNSLWANHSLLKNRHHALHVPSYVMRFLQLWVNREGSLTVMIFILSQDCNHKPNICCLLWPLIGPHAPLRSRRHWWWWWPIKSPCQFWNVQSIPDCHWFSSTFTPHPKYVEQTVAMCCMLKLESFDSCHRRGSYS
jgi:hypothetical protein